MSHAGLTVGRMKVDSGTNFSHADAAIATALAIWLSDSKGVGTFIGETKLRGFW